MRSFHHRLCFATVRFMMLFIIFLITMLVLCPAMLVGGYKIALRTGVDYKKRWLEAVDTLSKQQELAMIVESGQADQILKTIAERSKELRTLEARHPHRGAWRLDIDYRKASGRTTAYFTAVRTNPAKRVELGSCWDPAGYPSLFDRAVERYKDYVARMNQAEDIDA